MNQANDVIPRAGKLPDARPPGERDAPSPAEQGPLGDHPTYDELLDIAVDYTFPCSDPIAASGCSSKLKKPNG
jgi:hypothetical protein